MPINPNTASAMMAIGADPRDTDESPRRTDADDALVDLQTRTMDAQAGYDTMVEKAEPEFRPVASKFRDLHAAHATTLAPMLAVRGLDGEASVSVMGSINKAVVTVRALFDDIDIGVMDRIRSGEAHVREAFEVATGSGLAGAELRHVLQMRDELDRLLSDTRHLC